MGWISRHLTVPWIEPGRPVGVYGNLVILAIMARSFFSHFFSNPFADYFMNAKHSQKPSSQRDRLIWMRPGWRQVSFAFWQGPIWIDYGEERQPWSLLIPRSDLRWRNGDETSARWLRPASRSPLTSTRNLLSQSLSPPVGHESLTVWSPGRKNHKTAQSLPFNPTLFCKEVCGDVIW